VARQWRIRHKLMLGLGLLIGLMALLGAGTLNGLFFGQSTLQSIHSKIEEEGAARLLQDSVTALSRPAASSPNEDRKNELNELMDKKAAALKALGVYEAQLDKTLLRGRDPQKGFSEKGNINALHKAFDELDVALKEESKPAAVGNDRTPMLIERDAIQKPIQKLMQTSKGLTTVISDNMDRSAKNGVSHYGNIMIVVISATSFLILLFGSFGGVFYRWISHPIRDLAQGVSRVAKGDFDHRIEVHSGDEMEDLAAAFNDMTSRLQEMYRDLAHQVNERSRQLVRSERLASVGFLAAGVAHEINNPLASIAFCSEALESRLSDILAKQPPGHEVVSKYLKMIQDEAFRCKSITQRLLEFSRSGERRRESVDMSELIQSVLDMVQHLQNYKGKQILFEPVHAVYAWVNAQEIKSVVLNLVVNALDSLDDDGSLTITAIQRGPMAEMVFTDTGCGMTTEILENIFEPFFTRSRTGKGTGLGLSISHRVITQHGGEIEATSEGLNQGSTFTVRLPVHPAESVKEESLGRAAA